MKLKILFCSLLLLSILIFSGCGSDSSAGGDFLDFLGGIDSYYKCYSDDKCQVMLYEAVEDGSIPYSSIITYGIGPTRLPDPGHPGITEVHVDCGDNMEGVTLNVLCVDGSLVNKGYSVCGFGGWSELLQKNYYITFGEVVDLGSVPHTLCEKAPGQFGSGGFGSA